MKTFTLFVALFLTGVLFLSSALSKTIKAFTINRYNLLVDQAWLRRSNIAVHSEQLADGIPDHWVASNWASSRARFDVDQVRSHGGMRAVSIQKNNLADGAVISQVINVGPNHRAACSVFHQGAEAFLQILGDNVNTITAISESESWQQVTAEFQTAEDGNSYTVFLGLSNVQGTVRFDDAECRVNTDTTTNLLTNGEFEQDGVPFDPQTWWTNLPRAETSDLHQLNESRTVLAQLAKQSSAQVNRLLMIDLLSGRFAEVAQRAKQVSPGCLEQGGNQAPFLELARRWGRTDGLAKQEEILLSAITLMPQCPQAYAQMAELYISTGAYGRAGDYYQLARQNAIPGAQQGWYAFHEGMTRVDATGEWEKAIAALKIAEQNQGWEQAPWYHGAATNYLAKALRASGRCREAADAYTRVLACAECQAHHADARSSLDKLRTCPVS